MNRFVTRADAVRDDNAWTDNEWLARPDIVAAEKLMLLRATMAPGCCHPFHTHPQREEILYILSGQAEQWVGEEQCLLGPGDSAHIPAGVVHATYNPHAEPVVFLAILSPAVLEFIEEIDPFDVSEHEPWKSIRQKHGLPECRVARP